jgi:hypothetical protein
MFYETMASTDESTRRQNPEEHHQKRPIVGMIKSRISGMWRQEMHTKVLIENLKERAP